MCCRPRSTCRRRHACCICLSRQGWMQAPPLAVNSWLHILFIMCVGEQNLQPTTMTCDVWLQAQPVHVYCGIKAMCPHPLRLHAPPSAMHLGLCTTLRCASHATACRAATATTAACCCFREPSEHSFQETPGSYASRPPSHARSAPRSTPSPDAHASPCSGVAGACAQPCPPPSPSAPAVPADASSCSPAPAHARA